jgi:glycosyltransferase involved in cell wall biosynthesis
MRYRGISCFLPVYNEEKKIKQVVLSARAVLERLFEDYEIIIVNIKN